MKGRTRWLLLACGTAAMTSIAAGSPAVLSRMDAFKVQRVEIRGTKYLAPYDALVHTGITRTSNVFEDFEPWRERLLRHPMVLAVSIQRELPSTIKVAITEAEPVAMVRTPRLQPVDARARALPINPAELDLDLPVLASSGARNAHGDLTDAATRDAVAVLNVLRASNHRLYQWTSEIAPAADEGMLLHLRQPPGAVALVSREPAGLRLREIEVALSDLSARGELAHLQRIDARFRDQIVVSLRIDRN